ncbi:MAG TPA: DNA-binding response regulator [Gammaproteobacteria bacterium]|jgi:DNA-binding response OmpR family regulator|nr:DNA-binding response regulator [Gammaproteobacteria bacterium]
MLMHSKRRIKVVLVEDNHKLAGLISKFLVPDGMDIHHVDNGANAVHEIFVNNPDVVVLDWMLPNKDGLTICSEIRPKFAGKILMLTARDDGADELSGLTHGADDYVRKPVDPRVLAARIRLLVFGNERVKTQPKQLIFGRLTIDHESQTVTVCGDRVDITNAEFNLLWLLAINKNEVLSREELLMDMRGIDYDGTDRTIDNRIVKLRKKLGDKDKTAPGIQSVRSVGYRFLADNW